MLAVSAVLSDSAAAAVGGGSYLVRDINDTPHVVSSDARGFRPFGALTLFFAYDPAHGRELWRTDGTEAGTELVKDLQPGPGSSEIISCMVEIDGALLFTVESYSPGIELWRTDGTPAGTVLVREIPGSLDLNEDPIRFCQLAAAGGGVLFFAFERVGGFPAPYTATLWRTDGSPAGTVAVRTFEELASRFDTSMVASNGLIFFRAELGTEGVEPWRSDGTEAGTFPLADIVSGSDSSFPYYFAASSDGACFTAHASSDPSSAVHLWCSDGTRAGTGPVVEVANYLRPGVAFDGRYYFHASIAGVNGIWGSDGTPEGTRLVMGGDADFGVLGSSLYVFASEPVSRLLRSDGTMEGTTPVTERGGFGGTASIEDDELTFVVYRPSSARELWTSDLTSAGTVMRGDLGDTTIAGISNGTVYLAGVDPQHGSEPWIFDPATRMPRLLKNIGADDVVTPGSTPSLLTEAAGTLYFRANASDSPAELWRSDGTGPGTVPLVDRDLRGVHDLTPFAGALFFAVGESAPAADRGLWRSDGTAAGTEQLWKHPTRGGGTPRSLLLVGDRLFFTYDLGFSQVYPCVTDGSVPGTTCGAEFREAGTLAAVGETVFFAGRDRDGRGLWRTDGTSAGTSLVKRSSIAALTGSDTLAYFVVQDGGAKVLWSSDGTEQGTVAIRRFEPGRNGPPELRGLMAIGGRAFFVAEEEESGVELWTSDGTRDGTHIVRDLNPGPADSSPGLAAFGDRVVFSADDGVHGHEPWTTDGTAAGTAMLADLSPGPSGSDPWEFSDIDGMLAFAADDGRGRAPWVSDGTASGTRRVPADSPFAPVAPAGFTRVGSRVFFTADDVLKGNELWAFDLAALDACPGDCDGNRSVSIDEVITSVRLALGESGTCPAADRDADGSVTIAELVAAVAAALSGCTDGSPVSRSLS